jgi:hypothetical protein
MKILKKLILLIFVPVNLYAGEIYQKFGVFDHQHDTDAYALTTKYTDDKNINIKFLGELNPIYEISFYYEDNPKNVPSEKGYGTYISTGFTKKINLGKNFFMAPSFSAGIYEEFDGGKNMGSPLEFKSELELNYNLFKKSVIGISLNHISNGDISDTNPGADNILFNLRLKENF